MSSRSYLLIGAAGALAVIIAVAAIAAASLSGDGREKSSAPAGATTLSAEVGGAQPPATPAPPTPTPEPEPVPLPDRTSCEEIRGTDYRSEGEHQFFVANCIPTPAPLAPKSTPVPQPAGPAARPPATPMPSPQQRVITPTIEGWWFLLFEDLSGHTIRFDAGGKIVAFQPPERAPGLSGTGSISGAAMTINATGFVTDAGATFSFAFNGTRLADADFTRLNLPEGLAPLTQRLGGVAFRGVLQRSDMSTPNTVVAVWLCRDCNVVFHPIP